MILPLREHDRAAVGTLKKMAGWLLRAFKTRKRKFMIFLKTFILFRGEYCCLLTSPIKAGEAIELEKVQRSFTVCTNSAKNQNYGKQLKALKLFFGAQAGDIYRNVHVENPRSHVSQFS